MGYLDDIAVELREARARIKELEEKVEELENELKILVNEPESWRAGIIRVKYLPPLPEPKKEEDKDGDTDG